MKRTLLFILLFSPWLAQAGPASDIAWTPKLLNFVKQGNPQQGKKLAGSCSACHGEQGQGMPAKDGGIGIPALAGQLPTYSYKQLRDYAKGQRDNPIMSGIAQGLSEQDSADLAVWFSSLKPAKASGQFTGLERAEKMVSAGDGKRILPPCFVCHGAHGKGEKMDIPALAGQQADYFAQTLLAYKNGERHNDIYSRMRLIAQQLSEAEIQELAKLYQAME